ncbi:hypothetical protein TanjilG_11220 [Lupinus angustifolius]|uniref:Uncharacterized protein n=1 Tax=Lupinus angustifolius TaxID=3871 RepID=A0A1J7GPE9_LUPAN|nr:hypothetical protein TanjilG_11220 [Lupinus angustifolius]
MLVLVNIKVQLDVVTGLQLVSVLEGVKEGVVKKAPSYEIATICKSLVAGGVSVQNPHNIKYIGTIQGLKYIWRTEGFCGLFKGNGTNCARIVPNSALKFFNYEQASKCALAQCLEDARLTPLLRLGAGACAGIIAMSATYPMDVVQGRITVQTEKSPYQYRGMFHALSTVLREEGPRALYKGWLPSVIGVMVGWNHAAPVLTGDGRGKVLLQHSGMVDAFRKPVRHEGFGALYKGLVPNSVKNVGGCGQAPCKIKSYSNLYGLTQDVIVIIPFFTG